MSKFEELCEKYPWIDTDIIEGVIVEGVEKLLESPYQVFMTTNDREVSTASFDTLREVEEHILSIYNHPDDSGWLLECVSSSVSRKILSYKISITVEVTE